MGQALVKNYVHIVFSTKFRKPFIYEGIEEDLFAYLGGICKELDCQPIKVGGYRDHVHILCKLSKHITLVDLVTKVKTNSSRWIKRQGVGLDDFAWQGGYSCFSVYYRAVDRVAEYIANQRAHHGGACGESFGDELKRMSGE